MNYEIYDLVHVILSAVFRRILVGYSHTNPILCDQFVVSIV